MRGRRHGKRPQGKIYLSYVITSGIPLLVWAAVLAVLTFGLIRGRQVAADPSAGRRNGREYRDQAAAFRDPLAKPRNHWYWSGLSPFPPPGDDVR